MRTQLSQRLAVYEVTRPPLGRCTRTGAAALAAWWGTPADETTTVPFDDGLVVDLLGDPLPATRRTTAPHDAASLSV
ncbi:MAG TPA: hypothetical protein VK866_07090 [Acidimicrobiales bacterium]|nr:hypothetical protein [Acidimicrobiales bacterium]